MEYISLHGYTKDTPSDTEVSAGHQLINKTNIMASGPITSRQIDGETVTDFILGAPKSLQMVTAAMKLKDSCSLEKL